MSSLRALRHGIFVVIWYFFTSILVSGLQCHGLSAPHPMQTTMRHSDELRSPPAGFYIHIPYCRRRCRYCNFSIVPVGLSNEQTSFGVIHEQYQADIFAELDLLLRQENGSLSSIYFGGGTPSLAPVTMIQGILDRILTQFTLESDAEITMEMDPGTFTILQLQELKDLGINRISLGVQSFEDSILEAMGRVHRQSDIMEAVHFIHQVYGENANFSIDLISGVPGLTQAKWVETLQIATSLKPSHLSIYDLQVEEGTVFGTWYSKGSLDKTIPALPNEESVAFMYKFCAGYLRRKGFEHYEGM